MHSHKISLIVGKSLFLPLLWLTSFLFQNSSKRATSSPPLQIWLMSTVKIMMNKCLCMCVVLFKFCNFLSDQAAMLKKYGNMNQIQINQTLLTLEQHSSTCFIIEHII